MFRLYDQPLQARPSLIFPFLPFFCPPVLSPAWMGWLSPIRFAAVLVSLTTAHTPPTGLVLGFAGVVSLSCPQTGQKSPHRSKFGFSPQNELTPPPKGGGAGYRLSWVCWVCPARAQLPHTAPTGPFWGLAGIRSLLSFQNRTQGHTGPSLVFTAFSWCALGLAKLPNPAPACIPLLPGWVGSCNANSRSAPNLPLFLPS